VFSSAGVRAQRNGSITSDNRINFKVVFTFSLSIKVHWIKDIIT
jgi:hypothetical protein